MSDTFTICFRLPVRFRAPLTKLAKAAHGSINQQVVIAVASHLAATATRKTALSIAKTISAPKRDDQTAGWFEVIHPKRKPAPKRVKVRK